MDAKPKRIRWLAGKEAGVSAGDRLILFLSGYEMRGRLIVRAAFGQIEQCTPAAIKIAFDNGGSAWVPLFTLQFDPKRSGNGQWYGRFRIKGECYLTDENAEAIESASVALAA